jgi:5'-nucleotidase
MGLAAKKHADETFTNMSMVANYRRGLLEMSPPVVLLDMDGVVVDWDRGFVKAWGSTSPIDRSKSYAMQECVPEELRERATALFHRKGFFAELPPAAGAVETVRRLVQSGYQVFFCTAPVLTSVYCASEKYEWIVKHFGPEWASRVIMTTDKTTVRGDVLLDDKPLIKGSQRPTWSHILFDAPYNATIAARSRVSTWAEVEQAIIDTLARKKPVDKETQHTKVTKDDVAALLDFAHLLPADYRADYQAWRSGDAKGAKGEAFEAAAKHAAMQDSSLNLEADDFTEVTVFRSGYANWRRGGVSGAKSIMLPRGQDDGYNNVCRMP